MCVLLCVFTACVLGEGVEMSSWLDGHSFILLFLNFIIFMNDRTEIMVFQKSPRSPTIFREFDKVRGEF